MTQKTSLLLNLPAIALCSIIPFPFPASKLLKKELNARASVHQSAKLPSSLVFFVSFYNSIYKLPCLPVVVVAGAIMSGANNAGKETRVDA